MDDLGIGLHKAAIGVPGQSRIAGQPQEATHCRIIESDVEDGLHHAGHRDRGAGANGHRQRLADAAEAKSGGALQRANLCGNQVAQAIGARGAAAKELTAERRAEHEGRRDGHAQPVHLHQVPGLETHAFGRGSRAGRRAAADQEHLVGLVLQRHLVVRHGGLRPQGHRLVRGRGCAIRNASGRRLPVPDCVQRPSSRTACARRRCRCTARA